jgi:hypothetical protein
MKLRSLELEQFRKFEAPVRLRGFADGLNILAAPNEFGKSTILAAIRGLLFERYSSKAEPVRRMQSWRGNAAPRLAMEFDLGNGTWRIEKRFMHLPSARLTAPDGRLFEADAAEEELQRLLNFGAAGRKGATGDHLGVWGALWVTQRQSVEQADLSSELAKSTVAACLDAEVGVLTGSERGHAIKRAAEAQLARLHDGNNRPKGRYKDVLGELSTVAGELRELRERAQSLQEASDALRQAQARLARTADRQAADDDRTALEDARRRLVQAENFANRRAAAELALDLARREANAATAEQESRAAAQQAIAGGAKVHAETAAAANHARAAFEFACSSAATARNAAEHAETGLTKADAAIRLQRDILAAVEQDADLRRLEETLIQAEAAQSAIERHLAELAATGIDKPRMDAIRKAVREHDTASAALRAVATEIDLDLQENGAGVTIDGVPARPGRHTIHAVSATEIAIPGLGRIAVRPAIQDRETLQARLRKANDKVAETLAAAACLAEADAEQAFRDFELLQSALAEARARLMHLTPGDAGRNIPPGLAALRERVAVLRLGVASVAKRPGMPDNLPSRPAAMEALAAADAAFDAARAGVKAARAEQDAADRAASDARATLIRAEEKANAAAAELARMTRDFDAVHAREPADILAERVRATELARARQANLLAQMDRDRPADTVAGMQARIERYEKSIANRDAAARKLGEEIAALHERITMEGGAGLDELIAAAERREADLMRERDAAAFEADTLKLLLQSLTEAERSTRERYLAPITKRITPYLASLFPGASIRCDGALRIAALARGGATEQDFERLSDGTQEQIAVLARLAFAELLLDQGKPAMVILDDALAYSDDDRMERMFDTLTAAARRMQILVLTCRENVFARSGGQQLSLETATTIP